MHIVNLNILLRAFTFVNWLFLYCSEKASIYMPLWGIKWGIVLLHYRLHARNRQQMHQTEQMHEIFQLLHASSTYWRLRWKPSECLFVCSSRVYRPTREFFTHMETSLLPVKFWPVLGTHGHWAVRVLYGATPTKTGASVYNGHLRGPMILTLMLRVLQSSCHYFFLRLRSVAAGNPVNKKDIRIL